MEQNRECRNRPIQTCLTFDKVVKAVQWRKDKLLKNAAGATGYPQANQTNTQKP